MVRGTSPMVMMRVEHCEKDGCYEGMVMVYMVRE